MREEHVGAVHAAKEKIGEIQAILAGATDAAEEMIGVVAGATGGENCGDPSGRGAFERAARVPDLINDVYATLAETVNELDAYLLVI